MGIEAIVVSIVILVLSVVMHEVAHGYAANYLGDPTARLAGRLTLNPVVHVDLFGSIFLPGMLLLIGSPILFGYAKPVPYNPYNLKGRFGEAFVAAAGPLTNFGLALVLGLILRFGYGSLPEAFIQILGSAVFLNLLLGVFNLIPIPPLDGSKVLSSLLPGVLSYRFRGFEERLAMLGPGIGFALVILVFWIFSAPFSLLLSKLFVLLTGFAL